MAGGAGSGVEAGGAVLDTADGRLAGVAGVDVVAGVAGHADGGGRAGGAVGVCAGEAAGGSGVGERVSGCAGLADGENVAGGAVGDCVLGAVDGACAVIGGVAGGAGAAVVRTETGDAVGV